MRFIWRFFLAHVCIHAFLGQHWAAGALMIVFLLTSLHNSVVEQVIQHNRNNQKRHDELVRSLQKKE